MRYFAFAFLTHDENRGGGCMAVEHPTFPNMSVLKDLIRQRNTEFIGVAFHITNIFEFKSERDYLDFTKGNE